MLPLHVIIPVFLILGLLQAGMIALSVQCWLYMGFLGSPTSLFFGMVYLFTTFLLYPILVTVLISFTLAPSLLAFRANLSSNLSKAYTNLIPTSLASLPPLLSAGTGKSFKRPSTAKEWGVALLSGYVGLKVLGTLPSVLALVAGLAVRAGAEDVGAGVAGTADVRRGRGISQERGGREGRGLAVRETGVSLRRRGRGRGKADL